MSNKIRHSKFGLAEDPRHLIVKLHYQGRTLLGRVKSVRHDEITGCFRLTVYHFCGDPWPIEPTALAVDIV